MRHLLTPSSMAATIRMLRTTFVGSFLLIEGAVDARLYGRLVNRGACHVQVCHNRASVICVVRILDSGGFIGHLGIIDRDFSALLHVEVYSSENLLLTDENDIELTILSSDALDRFVAEYGNADKIAALQNRKGEQRGDILMRSASAIGPLRLRSRINRRNLKFDD